MKTATVGDLRQRFNAVLKSVETGEEITVTRRGVVVATLIPTPPAAPPPTPRKVDWARRFRERTPIEPKKPLTAEETAEFYRAMKRDF